MSDLKLDLNTGDLDLSSGNFELVTGPAEITQHIRTRLRFFLGECYLDTRIGVPWFQRLLGKRSDQVTVRGVIVSVTGDTPGVARVERATVDFDRTRRFFNINMTVIAQDGTVFDYAEELVV